MRSARQILRQLRPAGLFQLIGSPSPAMMGSNDAVLQVRHLVGELEEHPCLQQMEDECAAMYFNVIYGARLRRRFTTERSVKSARIMC